MTWWRWVSITAAVCAACSNSRTLIVGFAVAAVLAALFDIATAVRQR